MSQVLLTQWARLLVDTLVQSGVRDAVISPGSRSTPFTWAALQHPQLRCHSAIDERSAAFFALGQAKLTGRPSLLIATSGSAMAHYSPAFVEASYSFTPLLALTADRPVELWHRAAPQTIDQPGLFGRLVRGAFDLGAPGGSARELAALMATLAQAVRLSLGPVPGAVHLNAPAQKPLEPVAATDAEGARLEAEVSALIARGPTRFGVEPAGSQAANAEVVALDLARAERGLIVCGALPPGHEHATRAVLGLARATGFPLIAEVPSQLVLGELGAPVAPAIGSLFTLAGLRASEPDFVLQLGPPLTSQAWLTLEASLTAARRHVVARYGWPDVAASASWLYASDPGAFAARLTQLLEGQPQPTQALAATRAAWNARFAQARGRLAELQDEVLAALPFGEAHAARQIVAALPAGSLLVLGNSLPLRAVDAFSSARSAQVTTLVQRGANGIDGLVSGAAGVASVGARPTTLVLGDVSFAHDVGGLLLARGVSVPLAIVVIDNAGGRIFDTLPLRAQGTVSEAELAFWRTPPDLALDALARGYGVRYRLAENAGELDKALTEAYAARGATLVHVRVSPTSYREAVERLSERVGCAAVREGA